MLHRALRHYVSGILLVSLSIFLLALAVRWPAVEYGLPYEYGWDEPEIMIPALRVLRDGAYVPQKLDYGPLNGYVHAAWGLLSYVRGLSHNQFPDSIWSLHTELSAAWYWTVISPYILKQARLLSALLGSLSAVIICLSAFKMWGRLWPAALAGGIMALNGTFVGQTRLVTSDATSITAVCVSLWASVWIFKERARWAYAVAGVAAAAAMAFKYNNVFALLLPVMAHLSSADDYELKPRRDLRDLLRCAAWFTVMGCVLMLPAFLDPTRFLHSVTTLLSYYAVPEDSTILTRVGGYIRRFMALLDMGRVAAPGKSIKSVADITFHMRWAGLGEIIAVISGLIALAVARHWRVLLFLLPVVIANFTNVGGDTGYFFTRYLLLSLPALAMIGGFAAVAAEKRLSSHRVGSLLVSIMVAVLLAPALLSCVKSLWAIRNTVDPRVQMSQYMASTLPSGSRVLILDETRWQAGRLESRNFKLGRATALQVQQNPEVLKSFDYMVAPASVTFFNKDAQRSNLAAAVNGWLAKLAPAQTFGTESLAYDAPTLSPSINLVSVKTGLAGELTTRPLLRDRIPGTAFMAQKPGLTLLGNGELVVRPQTPIAAQVELSRDMRSIVVGAQGSSVFHQKDAPSLDIEVLPLDDSLKPVNADRAVRTAVSLERSLSGLVEYTANMDLSAGRYQIILKAKDPESNLVRLLGVEFR